MTARRVRPDHLVILVGAGVSTEAPSNIPAGDELTTVLVDWLTAPEPALRGELATLDRDRQHGPYAGLRFELLVEWLVWAQPSLTRWLERLDDAGRPNLWHHHLAQCAVAGATVLTTNFDTRLERAAEPFGGLRRVVLSASHPRARQLEGARLVKLHGSFSAPGRRGPVTTLSQVAALGYGYERSATLRRWVSERLDGATLLVTGYSGWDSFDVMPMLEVCANNSPIWWHRWRSSGELVVTDISRRSMYTSLTSPLDDFIRRRARSDREVRLLTGSTAHLFQQMLPSAITAAASAAFDRQENDSAAGDPADGLARLQETLADPLNALPLQMARAVVAGLLAAHGSEDRVALPGQRAAIAALVQPVDDEPLDPFQEEQAQEVKRLVESGHGRAAYDRIAERLEQLDPGADLSSTELSVTISEEMFQAALHRGTLIEARDMVTVLTAVAGRRRSLWGLARAANASGHVALRSSQARRLSPARVAELRRRACTDFIRAAELSLRLNRLDGYIDATRLAIWTADDNAERNSLLGDLTYWLHAAAPTVETATALYDLAAWAAAESDAPVVATRAAELGAVANQNDSPEIRDMLIVAEFAAAATAQPQRVVAHADEARARLAVEGASTSAANRMALLDRVGHLAELISRH